MESPAKVLRALALIGILLMALAIVTWMAQPGSFSEQLAQRKADIMHVIEGDK